MRAYTLEEKYRVIYGNTKAGCQEKYERNGYWYKVDTNCSEGRNEYLASLILECSNISNFVKYSVCTINGKNGCRSSSFVNSSERIVTIEDIIRKLYGVNNASDLLWSDVDIRNRFKRIVEAVYVYTGKQLNIAKYLCEILYLDMFILNRDRHLDNIGIILNSKNGRFREAPVFDNGLSFLGGCMGSIMEYGIERAIESQASRTISGSFTQQAYASSGNTWKSPIKINFRKLGKLIENNSNLTRIQREVIKYQYKSIGKLYM